MSDYLDKIQTQKKDGTPLATVPFRDSAAREDITTIQNELTTDTTTIEGNPLNFTTLSAQTAKSTILSLEPIQDLHGYDYPWIAGAGKNKLDVSKFETPSTFTKNNEVFTNNIVDSRDYLNLVGTAGSTVVFTKQSTPTGLFVSDAFTIASDVNRFTVKHSGEIQDLIIIFNQTIPSGSYKFVCTITNNNPSVVGGLVISNCMLILSTEPDSSFAPYENLCPISGRTEIGILGCGKNLGNSNTFTQGVLSWDVDNPTPNASTHFISSDYIKIIGNTNIVLKSYKGNIVRYYELDDNHNKLYFYGNVPTEGNYITRTTHANCKYIIFSIGIDNETVTPSDYGILVYGQLEYGSQPTTYESYTQSNDITFSLGQTVYGGTLDVENGVLVVDRAIYDMGDTNYTYLSDNTAFRSVSYLPGATSQNVFVDSISTCYRENQTGMANMSNGDFRVQGGLVYLKDFRFTDPSDLKTAITGEKLVYELATPITINLTPHTINLLKGVNNISVDDENATISLTYRDGKVATLGDLTSAVDNLDSKIDESKILTDTATGDKYILVVTNGVLDIQQISN